MQLSPTSDWVKMVLKAGRVVQNDEKGLFLHEVWSGISSGNRFCVYIRYLRGNNVVLKGLCEPSVVDLQRQRRHAVFKSKPLALPLPDNIV
jgi:hypothetical protein